MRVWVMSGIHEGDMWASTHLTEKGAILAAIADVLEYLNVSDAEGALDAMNHYGRYSNEANGDHTEAIPWDPSELRRLKSPALWKIFAQWSELTWDNCVGYSVEVMKTTIEA